MSASGKQTSQLKQAVQMANAGERSNARAHLRDIINREPENYIAWAWLAYVSETNEEKRAALYRAVQIQPQNDKLRSELQRMNKPRYVQTAADRGAFVSYSRADEIFAMELTENLKSRSLPVWIDMFDVPAQADWHITIRRALASSGIVLAVLSPDMISSADTRKELDYALSNGKIVLPITYRDCDTSTLDLFQPTINFQQNEKTGLRLLYTLLGITRSSGISAT